MSGRVTFRLGDREYATPLASVREVVRLTRLAELPGMAPPLAGLLELRGSALPVLDLRPHPRQPTGDVLVVDRGKGDDRAVGVAVDRVSAVLRDDELAPAAGGDPGELPGYVVEVLRGRDGVVLLVDLQRMVDAARRPVGTAQT